MRNTLAVVAFGFIILAIGAWYAFQHMKTSSAIRDTTDPTATSMMTLTSSAFRSGGNIPSQFTCDGGNGSPALSIGSVPAGAKSLAIIMDDPDVPKALKSDGVFDHWVMFNIPPETSEIPEGVSVGTQGANGTGKNAYTGPCPPPQYEPSEHRYYFKLYALDSELSLKAGASKQQVLDAMQGHIIDQAELLGKYKRISR